MLTLAENFNAASSLAGRNGVEDDEIVLGEKLLHLERNDSDRNVSILCNENVIGSSLHGLVSAHGPIGPSFG